LPHEYVVSFITPDIKGAGTDAIVNLSLKSATKEVKFKVGDRGILDISECETDTIDDIFKGCVLRDSTLEKGTISDFNLQLHEFIGEITEIGIEVDDTNTNDNPAWYLSRVDIRTSAGGIPVVWNFPVERWIGTGKDPYQKKLQVNYLRVGRGGPISEKKVIDV
jgi:hypothetical protein